MNRGLLIIAISLTTIFGGCALFTKAPQLLTLKRLSTSQKMMEKDIAKKKKNLEKLINDIEADKIKKGTSYKRFIRLYGKPVLEKVVNKENKENKEKRLLYRHPTEYFNTDKVYVYFDQKSKLIAWKYLPAKQKK
ncbi:MAG: hypothetical protein R6U54_06045 [Candidatus Omnitrophota bacterium]